MEEKIINTKVGQIKGYIEGNSIFYKGIPYAITNRFELPKEIKFEDVYDTANPVLDCYQYGSFVKDCHSFYDKEFYSEGAIYNYVESPMTLSVITPINPKNCSVLIFIHGGGFETGCVDDIPYGSSIEYSKRNIILVSIGYRLNVLSLYRNMNLGLEDQMFAINWVYDNIEFFGGNKDKITIMGQSAGAMSITNLLYTKKLEGKVKGAIMMSGAGTIPKVLGPLTKDKFAPFWDDIDKLCNVSNMEEAKKVPIEDLWKAWHTRSRNPYEFRNVQPGIDGSIITDVPQKILKKKEELDIPLMIGVTSQDFLAPIIYELGFKWAKDNDKKNKSDVYCYFFDRTLPGNSYKAFHACDLWYMFGNMDKAWRPFEEIDYKLSEKMIDYVANFVNNQNPNGEGLENWTPTNRKQKGFKLFDGISDNYIYPRACRKKVWHTFLKDKGPM